MGILESKRKLKNNFLGDVVNNIKLTADEKMQINEVRKDVDNSYFDFEFNTIQNDIKKQDARDILANKQCDMAMRESKNAAKKKIINRDTNNTASNIICAFFGVVSGILSIGGLYLSSNGSYACILFGMIMFVSILGNNLYIQNKLFDMFRLERKISNTVKIGMYAVIVAMCFVISTLTNKISMDYLLKDFTFNNVTKVVMSVAFSGLFDIVPLLVNSTKMDFNLCKYNRKFSKLFEDNEVENADVFTTEKCEYENNEPCVIEPIVEVVDVDETPQEIAVNNTAIVKQEEPPEETKKTGKRTSKSIYDTQRKFDNAIKKFCENGDVLTPSKINTKFNGTYQKLRDNSRLVSCVDGKYIVNY